MKLTKLAQSPIQHVLVYGPPKTGKTQLVTELTKEFNILYFGLENGHAPFYKLPLAQQERVEIVNIPDTRDYPMAIETMLKVMKGGPCKICDRHGKVNCPVCAAESISNAAEVSFTEVDIKALGPDTIVVIDSLTQITDSGLAQVTKGKDEDYKMQQDDWGNLGKLMAILLSRIQQAPCHLICISHETEAELEDGKNKIVPTMGSRNFSRNSAKAFDHVVYCQVSNMKHEFKSMTTKTVNIVVGSRTDVDTQKDGSLMPIFKGQVKTTAQPSIPTQSAGAKAASDLSDLLKKVKP